MDQSDKIEECNEPDARLHDGGQMASESLILLPPVLCPARDHTHRTNTFFFRRFLLQRTQSNCRPSLYGGLCQSRAEKDIFLARPSAIASMHCV